MAPARTVGAVDLSVQLITRPDNELRLPIERLAIDGEAIAATIDYLTCPQSTVDSISLRIQFRIRCAKVGGLALISTLFPEGLAAPNGQPYDVECPQRPRLQPHAISRNWKNGA